MRSATKVFHFVTRRLLPIIFFDESIAQAGRKIAAGGGDNTADSPRAFSVL